MNDTKNYTSKNIKICFLFLILALGPSLIYGSVEPPVDGATPASRLCITRKGMLAAPTYSQEWLIEGTSGERLVITTFSVTEGVVPQIRLLRKEGGTIVASANDMQEGRLVLEHEIRATGTYIVAVMDQGLDDEGAYEISAEKFLSSVAELQTSATKTAAQAKDGEDAGLSWWEIGALVTAGTAVTILTGPLAPAAMMVAARIITLFPG